MPNAETRKELRILCGIDRIPAGASVFIESPRGTLEIVGLSNEGM